MDKPLSAIEQLKMVLPYDRIAHTHFSESFASHALTERAKVEVNNDDILIIDQIRTFIDKSTAAGDLTVQIEMKHLTEDWMILDKDYSVTGNSRSITFTGPVVLPEGHSVRIRTYSADGTSRTMSGMISGRIIQA